MTAAELLQELRARGAVVSINGDRIRVRAPKAAVTTRLRASLVRLKPQVLRLLDESKAAFPEPFRFADADMEFGDIAAGWTPSDWAIELRRKADRCKSYRPDIGDYYERWAIEIEQRLAVIQAPE